MSYFVFYVNDTATEKPSTQSYTKISLLNAELNTICHLLALLGAHPIFHISRIRVKDHKFSSESVLLYANGSLTSRNCDVQFLCWYMTA
jgi:hypothetical protein